MHPFSKGDEGSLTSVGWQGAIADLYEDVTFSAPGATPASEDLALDAEGR